MERWGRDTRRVRRRQRWRAGGARGRVGTWAPACSRAEVQTRRHGPAAAAPLPCVTAAHGYGPLHASTARGTHHKLGPAGEPQPSPPSGPGPAPAPAGASSWGITAGTTIPFARALALAPQVVFTVIPTPGQSPAVGTEPTRVAKETDTA